MSKTLQQIFTANPITSNISTDLMYFVQSPYTPGTDAGMTFTNFAAQFGAPYTPAALTENNDTNVTLTLGGTPATALLNAVSLTLGWTGQLSLTRGGSNASLTASNGGIIWSNASQMQVLSGTSTARQMLQSGASATPAWSTTTWPATTTTNQILFSSATSVVGEITTAASSVLITSAGSAPSLSQTLPSAVQTNITALGAQSQALNMNSHQINNVSDPTSAQDAATKNYVDTMATGGAALCVCATTANLTATQLGAGVGATLTNSGAQAAFAVDGVTPAALSRVLVKNQIASQNNGIYTLTNAGSGITNWVLTRATDYNTPTEINDTGVIPVQSGTANANTGWVNTTINVAVDTTAITYVQFGASYPLSLANGGTNAALTASNGGIVWSNASQLQILSGTATASQILLSGANVTPAWSTTTYPATNAINTIMYASSANVLGVISAVNGGVLVSNNSGVPSMLANPAAAGKILQSANAAIPAWSTPTYPSASGGAGVILRSDGTNNVYTTATYPATTTINQILFSNAANTITGISAANSGVLVSSSTGVPSMLAAGTTGQVLQASSAGTPAWSTPTYPTASGSTGVILRSDGTNYVATTSTYPNTNAINTLLYASAANVMSALTTANSGTLVTSSTGVPSILAAGTTGQVLQASSAGTPAWSTPTYPTASGTSRKILVSDGTNYVASTETWAVPGSSGNILKSDGTNWTSAAGSTGTVTSVATSGLATGGTITSTGTITVTAATSTDQHTGTSTTVAVVPNVQQNHDSAMKAWVNGSTNTANGQYNVSGIVKNSTGNYTISYTTAIGNTTYTVNCNHSSLTSDISSSQVTSTASASCTVITQNGSGVVDPANYYVQVIGRT